MAIDEGFKGSRKCKGEQKREKKNKKQKGITDFNSLKNTSVEEGENIEDEIIHGSLMGSEKDQKRQSKRKGNYKNSTASTDNCKWDEDKEHDKKRKRKVHFLESVQDQGNSKKIAREASEKGYMVISEGDAGEVTSRTHVRNKDQKRGKKKEDVASSPEVTFKMTPSKEKDVQRSTAATTNYDGKNKRNESYNSELKKDAKESKKKVSFSKEVEEFPPDQFSHEKLGPDNLVRGKRFTLEEDDLIRKSVFKYIEEKQLGEQGLHMVLHCRDYRRQVNGCWKDIGAALPWRPAYNLRCRAHILFERSEERKWEPEEFELLKRYHAENGPRWRKLADILGKSRVHVKDAWRRIKLPNQNKGRWSQTECQSLFDLVNLDLQMKAFEEMKSTYQILKNNIAWEAISDKISTRGPQKCCIMWYSQLTSSMVKEGKWFDIDDYKLIDALQKADVCCIEDVDWDSLLSHRSGESCKKRWYEMIRYLHNFWTMPFVELVDLLSERYCPEMIKYMEMNLNKKQSTEEVS